MEINVTKNILEPRLLKKWAVTVVLFSNLILHSAFKNIRCQTYIKMPHQWFSMANYDGHAFIKLYSLDPS